MPLVDAPPRSRRSLNTSTGLRSLLLLPFRPFAFVAKRTLLFCAAVLLSYVTITNMIGYDRLWSTTDIRIGANDRSAIHKDTGRRGVHSYSSDSGGNGTIASRPRSVDDSSDIERNYSLQGKRNTAGVNQDTYQREHRGNEGRIEKKEGRVISALVERILTNQTGHREEGAILQKLVESDNQRKHSADEEAKSLPLCPLPPPDLIGKMKQAILLMSMLKESDVMRSHPELSPGGRWKPRNCRARHKVAVIVPFRDRQSHLNRLIDFLVPMLERQLLDFRFIVTEQYGKDLFNKGKIMNAAFQLAETLGVDCVIFHDVDMFPQDDRNLYYCPDQPKHLGAFVNTLGYELWYDYIVGGVLAISMAHYRQVNGYSNMYWAWGGEDDDMGYRILANNLTIQRPRKDSGTYTMLKHVKRQRTAPSMIYKLLNTAKTRWVTDGLNRVQWKVVKVIAKPLYYHLYVDVGTPPDEWRYEKATKRKKKKR